MRGRNVEYNIRLLQGVSWDDVNNYVKFHPMLKWERRKYKHENRAGEVLVTYLCAGCSKRVRAQGTSSADDATVDLWSEGQDTHLDCVNDDGMEEIPRGLTKAQKNWVQMLFAQNYKSAGAILAAMNKASNDEAPDEIVTDIPTYAKLRSYLPTLQKAALGPTVDCTPDAFEKFAEEKKDEPANSDDYYVCGFELDRSKEVAEFRMCFSTPRLLGFCPNGKGTSDMVHGDDTANVCWNGFPVLLMGFTDKGRVFHPIILAVCSSKTATDYTFMYGTYKSFRPDHIIRYSMTDGASAIYNGLRAAYNGQTCNGEPVEVKKLFCWMHCLIKNFDKHVTRKIGTVGCQTPEHRTRRLHIKHYLNEEFKCLHQCSSTAMFDLGVRLWYKKYHTDLLVEGEANIAAVSTC